METNFKTNLLEIASRIRTDVGDKANEDYQISASLVASDIMSKIHANQSISPSPEAFGVKDAITSSIMMCIISANIVDNLDREGVKVDVLEVILETGKILYAQLEEDTRQTVIAKGFENYQMLINAANTQDQIKDFFDAIYKLTTSHIISSGMDTNQEMLEKVINVYSQQFDQLKQTLD